MKLYKHLLFLFVSLLVLSSCTKHNHLESFNFKGNVVKVESIVKTTMPLTELLYYSIDPETSVSNHMTGNLVLEFNKNGRLIKHKAYDIDGELLYDVDYVNDAMQMYNVLVAKMDNKDVDDVKIVKDTLGRTKSTIYYKDKEPVYELNNEYNEYGDIKYTTFKDVRFPLLSQIKADTTYYDYLQYDEYGNWTEAEVKYVALFLPRQNFSYKIKRQFTYSDSPSKEPLINQLRTYNHSNKPSSSDKRKVKINGFGEFMLPYYMQHKKDDEVKALNDIMLKTTGLSTEYLCSYEYYGDDAYVTFSINTINGEYGVDFNQYTLSELEESASDELVVNSVINSLNSDVSQVIRFYPITFMDFNDKKVVKYQFYRVGVYDPIPVYVESYSFMNNNGNYITITLSYQSNYYNLFHDDFNKIIKSIKLY